MVVKSLLILLTTLLVPAKVNAQSSLPTLGDGEYADCIEASRELIVIGGGEQVLKLNEGDTLCSKAGSVKIKSILDGMVFKIGELEIRNDELRDLSSSMERRLKSEFAIVVDGKDARIRELEEIVIDMNSDKSLWDIHGDSISLSAGVVGATAVTSAIFVDSLSVESRLTMAGVGVVIVAGTAIFSLL